MLLILEIALGIAAWKRGWKGWAVLPAILPFGIGFFFGLVMGPEVFESSVVGVGFIIELVCIAVLIFMVVKGRQSFSSEWKK